jgi:FAD/FMN-containing dehydrogenase
MDLPVTHIAALVALVGRDHVLTARDLAGRDPGMDPHNFGAGVLVRPASTAEVADVLRYCHSVGLSVVPHGGRTGISGAAVSQPGEIILSLERMNQIRVLDVVSRTAVVEAGVVLGRLAQAAAEHGLTVGLDLGARDSATLGGLVSTNAGGNQAFRHGTMRDRVLGLEAVLPDGTVLSELGEVRKRNEGYAVEQLFIGAEGTLGVVTGVALELLPMDGPVATALLAFERLTDAVTLMDRIRRHSTLQPTAFEVMSGNQAAAVAESLGFGELATMTSHRYLLLLENAAATVPEAEEALAKALETEIERGGIAEALIAQSGTQREQFWRLREDWAIDRARPGGLWYDVSVPIARLASYVELVTERLRQHDPSLDLYVVGHLADGNLHLTVNAERPITERYEEVAPLVSRGLKALGGSFSAEHGIGLEKRATLARESDPARLALLKRIKDLFDPRGIMNPGKILAP